MKDNVPFNCHATRQANTFFDCAAKVPNSLINDNSLTNKRILDTFKMDTLKCDYDGQGTGDCGIYLFTYIATM